MPGRSAEVVRCANCSAPLSGASDGVVVCTYCRTENRLRVEPEASIAAPSPRAPIRHAQPDPDVPARAPAAGAILLVVVVLLAVGGMGAFFTKRASPAAPATASSARLISWLANEHGLCLLDVNGDGAPDPISGTFGTNGNELTAIDAKRGTILWSTPFAGDPPSVWCAAGGLFVEHHTGFVVERRDPKSGAVEWSHPLPDKVESVAASPSCVRFVSTNGALSFFDAVTGAPTSACTPTEVLDPHSPRFRRRFAAGDLSIDVAKTGSGTPRIAVTATRNGKPVWERALEMSPTVIDPDAALGPGGLFVVGKKPGAEDTLIYEYLRSETGDVLFRKEEVTKSSESIDTMTPTAGLMIVVGTGRARAVDLATGAVIWQSP